MTNTFHDNQYNRPNLELVCSIHSQPAAPPQANSNSDQNETKCSVTDVDFIEPVQSEVDFEQESLPECRPIPSVRKRRQRFTLGCTCLTIGLLVISFSIPQRNEIIVPGGLTTKHGQLLAGQGTKRCANCHDAGDQPFYAWLTDVFTGGKHLKTPQSELCLKCHSQMAGPNELLAHNVSPELLEKIRQEQESNSDSQSPPLSLASFRNSGHTPDQALACAKCHKEHHGSKHDLAAMTDAQCQSCHRQKFASFENGHPPFKNYLAGKRRSRIAFDHASHFGKHFPAKGHSFNCAMCHQDDEYQNVKKLVPYEQSCAQCHDQPIRSSVAANLKIFSLPMLDVDAFKRIGADVGSWPEECVGDCDGPLSEVTRLLLSADPQVAKSLQQLGPHFDFCDLDTENSEQLRAAQTVILGLKQLFKEVISEGQGAIAKRLDRIADDPNMTSTTKTLAQQITAPVVKQAIKNWFPDLVVKNEIGATIRSQFRSASNRRFDDDLLAENPLKLVSRQSSKTKKTQSKLSTPSKSQKPANKQPKIENVTNIQDKVIPGKVDNPFSGKFAEPSAGELLAENPLKSLRKKNSATPNPAIDNQNSARQPSGTDDSKKTNTVKKTPNQFSQQQASDGKLLAVNPLKKRMQPAGDGKDKANKQPNLPQVPVQPTPPQTGVTQNKSTKESPNTISEETFRKFLEWSQRGDQGNWIVNRQTFSIEYQPTGHADRTLSSLLTFAAHSANHPASKPLFEKLSQPTSIGLCATCHTIDQSPNSESLIVNWKSITRDPTVRGWTRFSHRPHLIQPQTSDCSSCHKLDTTTEIKNNFIGFNPNVERGNFEPITIDNCMNCHRKEQASSSCTTCHSYHIGSKVITRSK